MNGERIFQILAAVLAMIAAFFLWQGNTDMLFAAAVLGACSFFVSIRFQIKERMREREASGSELDEEPAHDGELDENLTKPK